MTGYYSKKLSGERLKAMYESASPGIRQYLQLEINYARTLVNPNATVLELGCGYGRIMRQLAPYAKKIAGVDTSPESLTLGHEFLNKLANCELVCADAASLPYSNESFDVVLCLQNGISAFHVDQKKLIDEALRVTRQHGLTVFSTYSERFWPERLAWFEQQARDGFIGPIDYDKTGKGRIVCTDGFSATTVNIDEFEKLTSHVQGTVNIFGLDRSSLLCTIRWGK